MTPPSPTSDDRPTTRPGPGPGLGRAGTGHLGTGRAGGPARTGRLAALAVAAVAALAAAACSTSGGTVGGAPVVPGGQAEAGAGASAAGTLADPDVADEVLAAELLRVLATGERAPLDELLSPSLILQRSDGTSLAKGAYLDNPARVDAFEVTEVEGTRAGATRVVRYTAQVSEVIDGREITRDPVPRLSTFVWEGGRWRLVSHANFSPIPGAGATATTAARG